MHITHNSASHNERTLLGECYMIENNHKINIKKGKRTKPNVSMCVCVCACDVVTHVDWTNSAPKYLCVNFPKGAFVTCN